MKFARRFPQSTAGVGRLGAIGLAVLSLGAGAATKTYTLDADFALGILENLNYSAPNSNQLQINLVGVGSKYIFIANHDEDSVSKYDTVLNREVARYKTYAGAAGAGNGGNPSRIAIDVDGNAYVLNREPSTGQSPLLMKILVDTAIDRNGNSIIDTSSDLNNDGIISAAEMLPMTSNSNAGLGDERVAWAQRIGPAGNTFGRALCIAPDGKLWVGMWDQARYFRVNATDGTLATVVGGVGGQHVQLSGWNPYGCTVDKNGVLWSATLGSGGLGRVDTNTGASSNFPNPYGYDYGIAQGNGKIYQANLSGNAWTAFDPTTNTFSKPSSLSYSGTGIAVDGAGNILSTDTVGVAKFAPDGTLLWQKGGQPGTYYSYGVMVDGNSDVWVMNIYSNNVSKYRGTDGAFLGVFPTGAFPYVYTDGSGLTTKNTTNNKQGTWTVVYDSGASATPWGKVNWTDTVPSGASVEVAVRSADASASLDLQPYVPVAKNASFSGSGRYLQVRTRLIANTSDQSPILYDLTINSANQSCDVNQSGTIDTTDINAIRNSIGQTPTAGDARDPNGDGKITINDVRLCIMKCSKPQCAP
jgi:hypothetical protein